MKIGILQCGAMPDPVIGTYGDYQELYSAWLSGQGFTFENWKVFEGAFPESPDAADGWLVSGSRFGAYEAHDWIPPLEEFIRASIETARPIVGICFGHQIIAQALGGTVEKFQGGWNVGRQIYDFGGVELPLNAWHQDQVIDLPEGATRIASSATCLNAAILYGDRALTVQPHPEFGPEIVEILAENEASTVPEELRDSALEALLDPLANETLADQIADFFRLTRHP